MHLGMSECHKLFLVTVTLTSDLVFKNYYVQSISALLHPKFGVVIPLGMAERCIPFRVTLTLTLTSGLISRFFRAILQLSFLRCVLY